MASNVKGEIYCSYTCFDQYKNEADCMENSVEALGEYYDLDYDTWQTTNAMASLESGTKSEYESILSLLKGCSGEACRALRTTTSTWYKRNMNSKEQDAQDAQDAQGQETLDVESDGVTRHMSNKSYVVVGVILLVGLIIAYLLYNHVMGQMMNKQKQHKYSKIATRPNYGSNNNTTTTAVSVPAQQL